MGEPHVVSLRATRDTDLDTLNRITHGDDARWGTRPAPGIRDVIGADADHRTIRADGEIVGDVARWLEEGSAYVACRVGGAHRDDDIAGRALRLFLEVRDERPVRARVAAGDAAGIRVLERLGFEPDERASGAGNAHGGAAEELVYLLA